MIDDLGYGDGLCRRESQNPYVTSEGLAILGCVYMDFISLKSDKEEVCVMNDVQKAAKQLRLSLMKLPLHCILIYRKK